MQSPICHGLTLMITVLLSAAVNAQPAYPPSFEGATEVVYRTVGDTELKMWIFVPEQHDAAKDVRPTAVFFFGGGWRAGTPAQFESHCRYLASRGMVAATADYRVETRHGVKAVSCVEDAAEAVRWLRQNAKGLGIDPQRILAGGGSAGGHLACCTGTLTTIPSLATSDVAFRPNAMALFNPAVMLSPLEGFETPTSWKEKLPDIADRTGCAPDLISPIHHVSSGQPPAIIFHGLADDTVPYATVEEFRKRSVAAGNRCELYGFADAPHGFFNVKGKEGSELLDVSRARHDRTLLKLDQFLQSLGWLTGAATVHVADQDFVTLRGSLNNCRTTFEGERHGRVAFLGGSITEMNGYRPIVCDWLSKRFPETEFTFINAGLASTCSNTGAFRLQKDVLSSGPIDLLLVEFAVNDDQDAAHTADDCIRGMEGIVRHMRHACPNADILMTHFVNPEMIERLHQGKPILSAAQHEAVARHYHVSSVYLSKEVAKRMTNGTMSWKEYGGTHPGPAGNQLAADLVMELLEAGWSGDAAQSQDAQPHTLPSEPLLASAFDSGRFLPLEDAELSAGWLLSEPEWKAIAGSTRRQFTGIPLLHCTVPAAELQVPFSGTAFGAFVVAGPDAGQLEVSIDNGPWQTFELWHRFSKGLHYPRTVVFARELKPGPHRAVVRLAATHHAESQGTAARIVSFVASGN